MNPDDAKPPGTGEIDDIEDIEELSPLPSPPAPRSEDPPAPEHPDFIQMIEQVLLQFKSFGRNFLQEHTKRPPFFFWVIWFLGMMVTIQRIEIRGLPEFMSFADSWPWIWGFILLGGIILGVLTYYLKGLLYHARVLLSGGKGRLQTSFYLTLYAGLPLYLIIILSTALETIFAGNRCFTGLGATWWHAPRFAVYLLMLAASTVLSFIGALYVQGVNMLRGIIFFLILPAACLVLALSAHTAVFDFRTDKALRLNQRATSYSVVGDHDKALRAYEWALGATRLSDGETRSLILKNIGVSYEQLGDVEKALEYYEQALKLAPPDTDDYEAIQGYIHLMRNRTKEAVSSLNRALAKNPSSFESHNTLGLVYLGKYDDAFIDYEKALIHNKKAYELSTNPITGSLLVESYYFREKYDKACDLGGKLLQETQDDDWLVLLVGLSHFEKGRDHRALELIQKAVVLDPENDTPYIRSVIDEIQSKQ
ncbi:tetratricopeptide repeat protein [Acidobacteriota bacterium]